MQKENLNETEEVLENVSAATSKNEEDLGESMLDTQSKTKQTGENDYCAADSKEKFEKLIKGPYKEFFNERVQGIINKRFKEIKKNEKNEKNEKEIHQPLEKKDKESDKEVQNSNDENFSVREAEIVAMGYKDFVLSKEMENPTFKALINSGVDMLTAYQALHIDEIMDGSVKFGAEKAAKQMADSIRFKVGRPSENGLFGRSGFGTRTGVSGLTPTQRKELAKKALMGENVGF